MNDVHSRTETKGKKSAADCKELEELSEKP
jgi:hypothetical protein